MASADLRAMWTTQRLCCMKVTVQPGISRVKGIWFGRQAAVLKALIQVSALPQAVLDPVDFHRA
jgi:hypothetical protein